MPCRNFRASRSQVFYKKGDLKNFTKFTERHMWWDLYFSKKVFKPLNFKENLFYITPPASGMGHLRNKSARLPNNAMFFISISNFL